VRRAQLRQLSAHFYGQPNREITNSQVSTLPSYSTRFFFLCLAALVLAGCSPAAKKARALERADHYFESGDYDKAKIEYMRVLRIDRQNAIAFERLGTIWFEEGSLFRAGGYLLKARELAPNNLESRLKLARVFISIGRLTEANQEAMTVLQQSPGNGEALRILVEAASVPEEIDHAEQQLLKSPERDNVSFQIASADLALRKGDLVSAERDVQRALELDAKSSSAHLAMATIRLLQKDPQRSEEEFKAAADLAPARSATRLKYAEFKEQVGELNQAKAIVTEVTRQAPDYFPAWCLLSQIALREKSYDESLKLLENVFSRDSDNLDARFLRTDVLLAKGETQEAVKELERLEQSYPDAPFIKYRLARAYLGNNNAAQALATAKQAVTLKPDYAEAILLVGELNLRAGDAQSVASAMEALLKKRPNLAPAQSLLAGAYQSLGRLDDSASVIRDQIKAAPQSPDAYFRLGLILRQQNKADEARLAFGKALELSPGNLPSLDQLVELRIAKKDFEGAMQTIQPELQKTPAPAGAHFLEGKIYAAQGEFSRAEAALIKALELDPNFSSAYELLISSYVAANQLSDAVKELQAFLSKNPNNPRALMTLAVIYDRMKDYPHARDTYEKVLSTSPENAEAMNNLAYLYSEKFNQLDKAYELARKARSLQPTNPSIADTFGWVLYKKAKYQEALTLLRESAGKLPDNPEAQFHLGMASYAMGDTQAARTVLQRAVNASSDFPGKEEAQHRLELLGNDTDKSAQLSSKELETLLKEQPNDIIGRLRLAEAYEKQRMFAKAADAYEEALKSNSKLLPATIKLAQLNSGPLHNKEKALDFAKKARDLAPTDPRVAGILGAIAYQIGNFSWAYSLLQESIRQMPNDAATLRAYAWAAYSQGKVSEAQQIMQHLLETAQDSADSAEIKSFLAMTAIDQNPSNTSAAEVDAQEVLKVDPNYVPALMVQADLQAQRGDPNAATVIYTEVLQRYPDFAPAQKRLASVYAQDPNTLPKAYELAMKARKTLSDDPELTQILAEISYKRKEFTYAIQLLGESGKRKALDSRSLYYLGMSQWYAAQKTKGRESLERALGAGLPEPLATEAKRVLAESKPK
jgi:tetratricopeptide (TPR) repeat protein